MTQLTDSVFAVKIPDDATDLYLSEVLNNRLYYHCGDIPGFVDLPPGSYTLLFCSKDVTEELARKVVEWFNNEVTREHGKYYDYSQKSRTHTVADKFFETALESFSSLLQSQSILGNHAILFNKV